MNESVKFDDSLKSWVTRMASIIFEAYRALTTEEDRVKFSLTELMMWIESLKYYPKSDNEGHQTNYLTDASKRLFKSKYKYLKFYIFTLHYKIFQKVLVTYQEMLPNLLLVYPVLEKKCQKFMIFHNFLRAKRKCLSFHFFSDYVGIPKNLQ